MGNQIAEKEKDYVWLALAEFFGDNEIDYDRHAAKVSAYPIQALKEIFFREVAPVCGPNMLTPMPPVWLSFDAEWVVSEIRNLQMHRESALYKVGHELKVLYYRATLRHVWSNVEQAIKRQRHPGKED